MKKILLGALLLLSTFGFSQTPTMDDVLNKRVKGNLSSILLDNGVILRVGDTIKVGTSTGNGRYNFVTQNMFCMGSTNYSSGVSCIDGYYSMGPTAGGSVIIIKEIMASFKRVVVLGTHAQGFIYGTRILSISSALESGEIRLNGFMTSDEALKELKKQKDKLDLGLITNDEFNTLKSSLSKFIN